jgi:transposase
VLTEARAGRRAVYSAGASHFVFAGLAGWVGCWVRWWLPSPSGRKRYNVLAALNVITRELVRACNLTYINAASVCELLEELARKHAGSAVTVVLDNARYQRCAAAQGKAAELGIDLLFLPPYSPNLSLIERFWKFVKKQALYSKHYGDFEEFCGAIDAVIDQAGRKHKKELASLLTLNFQSFD